MQRKCFRHLLIILIIYTTSIQNSWGIEKEPPPKTPQNHSVISCPSKDFSLFIEKFSSNTEIQKAFTLTPLKKKILDLDAEPEPQYSVKYLKEEEIKFPLFPSRQDQINNKYKIITKIIRADLHLVTIKKEDTGYKIDLLFKKKDCWNLIQIDDSST